MTSLITAATTRRALTSSVFRETHRTRRVLVIGSGAIGLRTAVELLQRQCCEVILHSPHPPTDLRNCSVGAGGLWMPFRCDDPRVDRWALETLDELWPYGSAGSRSTSSTTTSNATRTTIRNGESNTDIQPPPDLVEILPAISFLRNPVPALPSWTKDPRIQFRQCPIHELDHEDLQIPLLAELEAVGYTYAWYFHTPIVNSPVMLQYLADVVAQQAVEMNVQTHHYYTSVMEMCETAQQLNCDAVINCTGLGAATICQEPSNLYQGARGILLQFDRQDCTRYVPGTREALVMIDEEPWGTATEPCYLIPRGNLVVVGGSYLPGDTHPSIRPTERTRLFSNAHKMGIDIEKSQLVGEWTGFRPKRQSVRCELDDNRYQGITVAHNYGHGGSGWTVNVGAAKECIDILLQS